MLWLLLFLGVLGFAWFLFVPDPIKNAAKPLDELETDFAADPRRVGAAHEASQGTSRYAAQGTARDAAHEAAQGTARDPAQNGAQEAADDDDALFGLRTSAPPVTGMADDRHGEHGGPHPDMDGD